MLTRDEIAAAVLLECVDQYTKSHRHMESMANRQLVERALVKYCFGDDAPYPCDTSTVYEALVLHCMHVCGGTNA